jgi:hexosaminidase
MRVLLFIAISYAAVPASRGQGKVCPIIPLPSQVTQSAGQLNLSVLQRININDSRLSTIAHFIQQEALTDAGLTLSLSDTGLGRGAVTLELTDAAHLSEEAYKLTVRTDQVLISASTPHGVFNGVVSLLQLVRIAAARATGTIPCWNIADAPDMKWRGLMLDESRHFFGKDAVENILDWMAFYKLNRFHWHLTDVPGWRMEIKAFPKLTLVGGIGNHTDSLAPAEYYTQREINEIVQYARARFIEVIPEVDMPGHARAANRAYPAYSGGGSKEYPDFTFNPGKEATYAYLTRILRELDVLFPDKMIHIGGDEVAFGNEKWNTDPDVQGLMKANKLSDLKEVEHYFTERMADSVIHLGAKVLGWDEIASTKIPAQNMIIFWWRQNKPDALKEAIDNGYKVVLCPRIPFYFDFVQDSTHLVGRRWSGKFSDLKTIYDYSVDQYREIIGRKNRDQVMGLQANIWTERIISEARLEYMLFPRITAVAEAAWTSPSQRDYSKFVKERLPTHLDLFKRAGLHYYDVNSPELTPEIVR